MDSPDWPSEFFDQRLPASLQETSLLVDLERRKQVGQAGVQLSHRTACSFLEEVSRKLRRLWSGNWRSGREGGTHSGG